MIFLSLSRSETRSWFGVKNIFSSKVSSKSFIRCFMRPRKSQWWKSCLCRCCCWTCSADGCRTCWFPRVFRHFGGPARAFPVWVTNAADWVFCTLATRCHAVFVTQPNLVRQWVFIGWALSSFPSVLIFGWSVLLTIPFLDFSSPT